MEKHLLLPPFLGNLDDAHLLQLDFLRLFDLVKFQFICLNEFSLPKYLNNVHGFDISSAGIIGALPYICMFLCIIAQGNLSDRLLEKKMVSRTAVRRIFNSIGKSFSSMSPKLALRDDFAGDSAAIYNRLGMQQRWSGGADLLVSWTLWICLLGVQYS